MNAAPAQTTQNIRRPSRLREALPALFAMLGAGALTAAGAAGAAEFRSLMLTLSALAALGALAYALRRSALRAVPAMAFCAAGSYVYIQLLSLGSFTWFSDAGGPLHLFGVLWLLALYLTLYALIGRGGPAAAAVNGLCLLFGAANYTLELFRGRPFLAIDVTSVRTAMNVTGSYHFSAAPLFWCAAALAVAVGGLGFFLGGGRSASHPAVRWGARGLSLAAAGLYAYLCLCTPMVTGSGIFILWDENQFADSAVMYFAVTTQKLSISAPEGYSDEALSRIDGEIENDSVGETKDPTIIVIMNESFSDLSVIADFDTTEPVTPFFSSLTENTVRGYVCSSVLGGNTANSEFEFLTGDTMAFVPTGTVPYQLYINYETDSLVSVLKAQGYTATALHPYLASGWNRVQVYDLLGFDTVHFKDDFTQRKYLRNYVTDQSDYENLIRWYEARDTSKNSFFFNITMQNHGGYDFADFEPTVRIAGHEGEFPLAEQYLSLIRESDAAAQSLIEYFSGVDDPVILLFFGDHQPNVDKGFYDLLYGHDSAELSLEERQRRYLTPFYLWANYDIPEADAGVTSINYLAPLLLETAGLRESDYQVFLSGLSETWPAVAAGGALDAEGTWHALSDEAFVSDGDVADYRILQYNHLFDPGGVRRDIFGLE